MEHPKFRAAFDLLGCALGWKIILNCSVWRSGGPSFRLRAAPEQKGMLSELDDDHAPRRRRSRTRKRAAPRGTV